MVDKISEVSDPVVRAKLTGIQESVSIVDEDMVAFKKGIELKIGAASALEVAAKEVFALCVPIQKKVKADEVSPEEAKLTINGIKLAVTIINQRAQAARDDIIKMRGQVAGMERAIQKMGEKFNVEAQKYERHERMAKEDADDLSQAPAPN